MTPSFMTESPCSRIDPELMFPHPTDIDTIEFVKERVCGTCYFRTECLEWAIDPYSRSEYGIFGGRTEDERKELIAARKLDKAVRLDYGPLPPKSPALHGRRLIARTPCPPLPLMQGAGPSRKEPS